MNMPGFTAEASLNASQRSRMMRVASLMAGDTRVVPQATAIPEWISEFWALTSGGGGADAGGTTCTAALDLCVRKCWFGNPVYDRAKAQQCEKQCNAQYNCFGNV